MNYETDQQETISLYLLLKISVFYYALLKYYFNENFFILKIVAITINDFYIMIKGYSVDTGVWI